VDIDETMRRSLSALRCPAQATNVLSIRKTHTFVSVETFIEMQTKYANEKDIEIHGLHQTPCKDGDKDKIQNTGTVHRKIKRNLEPCLSIANATRNENGSKNHMALRKIVRKEMKK